MRNAGNFKRNTGYHSLSTGITPCLYLGCLFMAVRQVGVQFLPTANILPGRCFTSNFFKGFEEIPVILKENTGNHSGPTGITPRLYLGCLFMTARQVGVQFLPPANLLPGRGFTSNFLASLRRYVTCETTPSSPGLTSIWPTTAYRPRPSHIRNC